MKISTTCLLLTSFLIVNTLWFVKPAVPQTTNNFESIGPTVFVDPQIVEGDVDEQITVSVRIFNLTNSTVPDPEFPIYEIPLGNLWSFELLFTWDPSVLEYANHTVTIPVETYSDGILHEPVYEAVNEVDSAAGTLRLEYTSEKSAEYFNNPGQNSTFFMITFKVKAEASTSLTLETVTLWGVTEEGEYLSPIGENQNDEKIYLQIEHGAFVAAGVPAADFSMFSPEGLLIDTAVVNKTVIFDASASSDEDGYIVSYEWDFGDGAVVTESDPLIEHTYTQTGTFTVSLTVTDNASLPSFAFTKSIEIVDSRNIKVKRISITPALPQKIKVGGMVSINVTVVNDGKWSENFNLTAYYNKTSISLNGVISPDDWTEIATGQISLNVGAEVTWQVSWGTSGVPTLETFYYVLINVTGVPYDDTADSVNIIAETPVFITAEELHDAGVQSLDFGFKYKDTRVIVQPVIEGEPATVEITVINQGTVNDTFSVELFINGSLENSWTTSVIASGRTWVTEWKGTLSAGNYNITAVVRVTNDVNDTNNLLQKTMRVIKPPKIEITYTPASPIANDTIILNASGTIHQEPGGTIAKYIWEIYNPYARPGSDPPTLKAEGVTANFTALIAGKWSVVLKVVDNFGIGYDTKRLTGTKHYMETINIEVGAKELPILPTFIAGVGIAILVVLGLFLYRRRMKS